jgi:hypothetical protein
MCTGFTRGHNFGVQGAVSSEWMPRWLQIIAERVISRTDVCLFLGFLNNMFPGIWPMWICLSKFVAGVRSHRTEVVAVKGGPATTAGNMVTCHVTAPSHDKCPPPLLLCLPFPQKMLCRHLLRPFTLAKQIGEWGERKVRRKTGIEGGRQREGGRRRERKGGGEREREGKRDECREKEEGGEERVKEGDIIL